MTTELPDVHDPQVRRDWLAQEFAACFGQSARTWARAPGRVDAMGSHTDYNGGQVLTVPIDRDTWIAAAPRDDNRVRVASLNNGENSEFDLEDGRRAAVSGGGRYVHAVAQVLRRENFDVGGCDLLGHGKIPLASGLSSSASLEAATAVVFMQLGNFAIEPVKLAVLCQAAENDFVGVNCGVLDQYSVILGEAGQFLVLDCHALTHRYARLPEDIQVVICDTNAPRQLSGSEYGARRQSCETGFDLLRRYCPSAAYLCAIDEESFAEHAHDLPDDVRRRCQFVIEEHARVDAFANAMREEDRAEISRLCEASFAGARDLFEICVPPMEAMVAAAQDSPGLVGVRQAGGGFGGCMIAFVDAGSTDQFADDCGRLYQATTGIEPQIYAVDTAIGAGLL